MIFLANIMRFLFAMELISAIKKGYIGCQEDILIPNCATPFIAIGKKFGQML